MTTGLSREEIIRLLDRGFTRVEVAEIYNTTPQNVNYYLNQKGPKYLDPRQRAMKHVPWKIKKEHKESAPFHRIRNHIKFITLGSQRMSGEERDRLRNWYRSLKDLNLVLEYHPDVSPTLSITTGGWRYVQREDRDGDLLIRVNDHTHMSDEAYEYFRFPDEEIMGELES